MNEPKRISVLDQPSGSSTRPVDPYAAAEARGGRGPLVAAVLVPVLLLLAGGLLLYRSVLREATAPVSHPPRDIARPANDGQQAAKPAPARTPVASSKPPAKDTATDPSPVRAPKAPAAAEPAPQDRPAPKPSDEQTQSGPSKTAGEAANTNIARAPAAEPANDANDGTAAADSDLQELTRAIEADVRSASAWKARAEAHRLKGNHAAAIADYDMTIALDPEQSLSFNDRGIVYFQMGDLERARNDFNWAITLNPQEPLAYFNRGLLHSDLARYAASEADFTQFLKFEPQDSEAWRRRGQARLRQNNRQGAFDDYSKALEIDPKDALALGLRCGAAFLLGQLADAERDCKAALDMDEKLGEALNNLAWLYYKQGAHKKGLPLAERAVTVNPDDAAYWDTRAHLLEALGERDLAISDFRSALKINPTQKESLAGLKRLGVAP